MAADKDTTGPAAEAGAAQADASAKSAAGKSAAKKSAAAKPATKKTAAAKPAAKKSAADKSAAKKTAAAKPAAKKSAVGKSAAKKTAAAKPAAKKSAADKSAAKKTAAAKAPAKKAAVKKTAGKKAADAAEPARLGHNIRISFKGFDARLVDHSVGRIVAAVQSTGTKVRGPVPLPVRKERVTVLVSPHKHKDARDQYEIRSYKRILDVISPTEKTMDALRHLDLSAGVDVSLKMTQTSVASGRRKS